MNSIGVTRMYSAAGTPGGNSEFLRYFSGPWCLMPTMMK